MKRALLALLAVSALPAATVFRVDPSPVMTTSGTPPIGGFPALYAVAGATINLCTDAACTVPATTYTDGTGATTCPSNAPVVAPGSTICSSVAGAQGQFGFWIGAGSYFYRVTFPNGQTFGAFPLTVNTLGVTQIVAGSGITVNNGGTGVVTITATGAIPNVSTFNFTPQSPGGTLTSGNPATVTLAPVPLGLNAANPSYSLNITGCSGGNQTVAITGGNAVSGNPSGTVIFTPSNSCVAGWTIGSSTGGIQESICALPSVGGEVIIDNTPTLNTNVNACSKTDVAVFKKPGSTVSGSFTILSFNISGQLGSVWVTTNGFLMDSAVTMSSVPTLPSQTANQFFAAPNGAPGAPAFRAMAPADVPPTVLSSTAQGGVTGTLPAANGGTGVASPPAHTVPVGEGASPHNYVGPGTAGQPLVSGGAGADPSYGTLGVPGGGTGATTLPAHCVVVGEGTANATTVCPNSPGKVLTDNGAGADPSFQAPAVVLPSASAQLQYLRTQPNSGNNTTYQFASQPTASAADYVFTPQTPGGSLAAGPNTITMTPCPLGVGGADIGHYVYISGGVGTAEAALITGGTCTSGASSGSLIVNVANTHTGAWTITSASGGIQEGANTNAYLFIPTGTYKVYAPITLSASVVLQCAGGSNSILQAQSATQVAIIAVNLANVGIAIRDCGFDASPAKISGAAITLSASGSAQNDFTVISNNIFTNQFIAVDAQKAAYWRTEGNQFELNQANGIGVQVANTISVDSGDQTIRDNTFYGGGSGFTDIKYISGGGLRVFGNKMLGAVGQTCMSVAIPSGVGTSQLTVQGNSFDGCGVDALSITMADSTATLSDNSISGNLFSGSPTHAMIYVSSGGGPYGRVVISANEFSAQTGSGPAIWLHSGGNIHVTSNLVSFPAAAGAITIDSGVSNSVVAWNPVINSTMVNNSTSTVVLEALQPGEGSFSPGLYVAGVSGISGAATQSLDTNFVATESGAANALVVTLNDPRGTAVPLAAGLCLNVKLAHTLQVGANTLSFNAAVKNIKSHLNPANNIGTAYASGAFFRTCYDGTQFQDMSQ